MPNYDKMTPEQIAEKMFVAMGYRQDGDMWRSPDHNRSHKARIVLTHPWLRHVFAVEVKDFMRIKGFYRRERDAIPVGLITFYNHVFSGNGHSSYENQDEYPRAVCIAALKALENENV